MKQLLFSKTDKILILAPHPDDESIGCGALISQYAPQIDVVLLTDGRFGGMDSPETIMKIRAQEFEKVMHCAKVHSWFKLGISDRELKNSFKTFQTIDFSSYTHIFIPHRAEDQCDHRWCFPFLMRSKVKADTLICGYEVWTPIQSPNRFLPIKDYEPKKKLISFYKSQLKYNDYVACMQGLNKYRGLKARAPYAECYEVFTFKELQLKYVWWHRLWGKAKKINGQSVYFFLGFHLNRGKKI